MEAQVAESCKSKCTQKKCKRNKERKKGEFRKMGKKGDRLESGVALKTK